MSTVGQRLRKMRERDGLSQSALGKVLGVTQSQVSDFERGARKLHVSAALALLKISGDTFKLSELVSKRNVATIAAAKAA